MAVLHLQRIKDANLTHKTMRTSIKILVCILLFNCGQTESQESLIDKFIQEVILEKKLDHKIWSKYLDFSEEQSEKGKKIVHELINKQIQRISSNIKKNDNEYSIIHYSDLKKNNLSSNLKYKDFGKVYFLIIDKKIITPIIVENEKIIAFFNGITKQKRNSYPWLLNKSDVIE